MRIIQQTSENNRNISEFVKCQSTEDLTKFRRAGQILSDVLTQLEKLVTDCKTTKTLLELDTLVEEEFIKNDSTPVFKHYHGFPASCCISINQTLVHGIPTNYHLQEGDLITFDTGCNYQGGVADSAVTCIYGTPKEKWHLDLIKTTKSCLMAGIKVARAGNQLGIIGQVISHTARKNNFKVIDMYGGHGISLNKVHDDSFVSNRSSEEIGIRLQPGMVLAIEPLVIPVSCSNKPRTLDDNWSVVTEDISCHFEHSIVITENEPEILTWRENEN